MNYIFWQMQGDAPLCTLASARSTGVSSVPAAALRIPRHIMKGLQNVSIIATSVMLHNCSCAAFVSFSASARPTNGVPLCFGRQSSSDSTIAALVVRISNRRKVKSLASAAYSSKHTDADASRPTTLLIGSQQDPASCAIMNAIVARGGWSEVGVEQDSTLGGEGGRVWEHARSPVSLWSITESLLNFDDADRRWMEEDSIRGLGNEGRRWLGRPSDVIFLSKHVARSGVPALCVHPIGIPNVREQSISTRSFGISLDIRPVCSFAPGQRLWLSNGVVRPGSFGGLGRVSDDSDLLHASVRGTQWCEISEHPQPRPDFVSRGSGSACSIRNRSQQLGSFCFANWTREGREKRSCSHGRTPTLHSPAAGYPAVIGGTRGWGSARAVSPTVPSTGELPARAAASGARSGLARRLRRYAGGDPPRSLAGNARK